ncbi:hypothetical protein Tsubulata_011355, partial [Turnera subulata]
TRILANHFLLHEPSPSPAATTTTTVLSSNACLGYTPAEHGETISFDTKEMRKLLDWHNIEDRDWLFAMMKQEKLFNPVERGGRVFVVPDYNQPKEHQREMTRRRVRWLQERGVYEGWLTGKGTEAELKKIALEEVLGAYDNSLNVKTGAQFMGNAVKALGTKRHHDKWLKATEDYKLMGCFAMTELGHGSNVRGLETVATFDERTAEFVINTPCETAQKYWIGGAANDATDAVVFTQLNMKGQNQGIHAFILQIRDANGNVLPNIRIADCGHKIGLNGVDNGRIWFDNVRIPIENMLNSVADVTPDGQYLSDIKDPDRRSAAFMSPLTSGRVSVAATAIYSAKISLAIAIRCALTRRAFSITPKYGPELLLLDYPSHQRRLLPLLAKTYAMNFAGNYLKMIYVKRTPQSLKTLHVVSSALKFATTWHNMRTLQECREACGGQGLKTENRIGQMKGDFDPLSTIEGDNSYMMHQVSKSLLAEYASTKKRNKPFNGLGLEHLNGPCPVIPLEPTSTILRSTQFQIDAFHLRERDLLNRFAAEVAGYQAKGESREYALLQAYQLAEDLARAFSDRLTLDAFIDVEARVPAGPLKRTRILANHFLLHEQASPSPAATTTTTTTLSSNACLSYSPAEHGETISFDTKEMRKLLDWHNIEDRDWLFALMRQEKLFNPVEKGGSVFVVPDYNQTKEHQREMTRRRIRWLKERGVYEGWLTGKGPEWELRRIALEEVLGAYDNSLTIKSGVQFLLWGNTVKALGTKRHHDKWLKATEDYKIMGCFAMTELGHGSNVRGLETIATFDAKTAEFVINTPCETAQKYWIGGAANDATHAVVFTQLNMNGVNQGVHAFIVQIRDANGNVLPNIRIADCGHKIGLNGVDNGRIWFDNVRIPIENMLNSIADVTPDGQYLSDIKDPDRRSAAFMSPLTSGRVTVPALSIYSAKTSLAIAIRYALTRRAFSITPNGPEMLLLHDYPSHQRRLLPLLAKTYAMNFAVNYLKMIYVKRTPQSIKTLHVVSSALKFAVTWHNMRTLQECRESCGGQGLKTENRIGQMKGDFDPLSTIEGDNAYMTHQVSKSLLAEYASTKKRNKPFSGLGLEHLNGPSPVLPAQLTSAILRSSQFQVDAFRLRERDLLNRFAAEVAEHQAKGENRESSLLQAYQHSEDLARAFSDRMILDTFIEVESRVPAGSLKDVLGLVRSMYAVIIMEEDSSFLRYGYLSLQNDAAIRKEVKNLCRELRPHALALVSSFGIPDAFLSPIAYDWIQANSWSSAKL